MVKTIQKQATKFTLDASKPTQDGIFDLDQFEKYLQDRIKVQGRTANLQGNITVQKVGQKVVFTIQPNVPFAKRYIKYLTKKFLKKHSLRDWLRVVANKKDSYELRYFNIDQQEEDEE
jgi:large subunit ribosomal protein L22e